MGKADYINAVLVQASQEEISIYITIIQLKPHTKRRGGMPCVCWYAATASDRRQQSTNEQMDWLETKHSEQTLRPGVHLT